MIYVSWSSNTMDIRKIDTSVERQLDIRYQLSI